MVYENQPEAVIENDSCKILWNFTVQTNHFITARMPNMIFIDKKHYERLIINFAIPYDTRVDDKEVEQIEKYLDLTREPKKVWNRKVILVPLVLGALGTPVKELQKRLKQLVLTQRSLNYKKLA